jgi:hypothetical protein
MGTFLNTESHLEWVDLLSKITQYSIISDHTNPGVELNDDFRNQEVETSYINDVDSNGTIPIDIIFNETNIFLEKMDAFDNVFV